MQVEAQIISVNPVIPQQEIDDVKARLRDYSDYRVNKGEAEFSTLAILSCTVRMARVCRVANSDSITVRIFVPEFSNVAFNLNDPKKVSRIVGRLNMATISSSLSKSVEIRSMCAISCSRPKVSGKELTDATVKLDSLRKGDCGGKIYFR